jgi:hypothetical protein
LHDPVAQHVAAAALQRRLLPSTSSRLCFLPAPQRNHLSGLQRKLLKLSFWSVQQLMDAKRDIAPLVEANKRKAARTDAYQVLQQQARQGSNVRVSGGGAGVLQYGAAVCAGHGAAAGRRPST